MKHRYAKLYQFRTQKCHMNVILMSNRCHIKIVVFRRRPSRNTYDDDYKRKLVKSTITKNIYQHRVAYLTQSYIVWLFQTVWRHNSVDVAVVDKVYNAASTPAGCNSKPSQQQHIGRQQRMHEDTAVALSLTRPVERSRQAPQVYACYDIQSSEVNSWQSTLMSLWN